MARIDLHMHSIFSDGTASIQEAIQIARQKDLDAIAITDHFTTTWKASIINSLSSTNFNRYIQTIKERRDAAQFPCLIGIEIDMGSSLEAIRQIPFHQFEILTFEYVDSFQLLKKVVKIKDQFQVQGLIALAHNSFFKQADLEQFCTILTENDIYLELNTRYLSPRDIGALRRLKQINKLGVRFTIGSDAHSHRRIGDIDYAIAILKEINGFNQLISLNDLSSFYGS
ncbi:MAG: PHP domain-containing protein [Candidatus Helarchaeota archaeon]